MDPIKFKNDYGYPPASEAFFIWHGGRCSDRYETRAEAERQAALQAITLPGEDVLVLAAVSAISTSKECVGRRFSPDRTPSAPEPPEFDEVPETPKVTRLDPPAAAPEPEFPEADDPEVPLAEQEPI